MQGTITTKIRVTVTFGLRKGVMKGKGHEKDFGNAGMFYYLTPWMFAFTSLFCALFCM